MVEESFKENPVYELTNDLLGREDSLEVSPDKQQQFELLQS